MDRDRIRVLHFTRFINRHDFIDTVIRFADRNRFRLMACTLIKQTNIEAPQYETAGIPHAVLHCGERRQYLLAILRLAWLLRRCSVDVLHTHHYEETLIGVLAAKLAGAARVVVGRHYHDELYQVAAGMKLRKLLSLEGFCNRTARTIVVPTTLIRRLLVERQAVPERKVRVIPYGFEFEAERYRISGADTARSIRRELGLDGHFVIGNFGRHFKTKGQDYLIQGFAKLARDVPEARLLIVGDGPSHQELRALADKLEISQQVIFTGWRPDAARLMEAVDVVAHPTLHEALPQVMVEALAKGKPLIISDVSGSDHIDDMRTGILIPLRDVGAIFEALRWVVEHPEEARLLGERGRAYVLENLDIRRVIRQYEACYEAVAG
jgi:glycosyltransferase involved in cell wall biosynthesis